jgi:hypothetical protein
LRRIDAVALSFSTEKAGLHPIAPPDEDTDCYRSLDEGQPAARQKRLFFGDNDQRDLRARRAGN